MTGTWDPTRKNITSKLLAAGYTYKLGYSVIRYSRGKYTVVARFIQGRPPIMYMEIGPGASEGLMTTLPGFNHYLYTCDSVREFMQIATGPEKKIEPRIRNRITKKALEALD